MSAVAIVAVRAVMTLPNPCSVIGLPHGMNGQEVRTAKPYGRGHSARAAIGALTIINAFYSLSVRIKPMGGYTELNRCGNRWCCESEQLDDSPEEGFS